MANTTKYVIPKMDPNGLVKNGPADVNTALDSIDSKMVGYSEGVLASRPVSTGGSPGVAGRIYKATDTGVYYVDTGTAWKPLNGDAAYAEVLTAQGTASTTPADLATAGPSVTVVVPTNGLVMIRARVQVQGGSAAPGRVYLVEDGINQSGIMDIATSAQPGTGFTVPGSAAGTGIGALSGWLALDPTAGSRTYKLMYSNQGGASIATFQNRKLWARVLPF